MGLLVKQHCSTSQNWVSYFYDYMYSYNPSVGHLGVKGIVDLNILNTVLNTFSAYILSHSVFGQLVQYPANSPSFPLIMSQH